MPKVQKCVKHNMLIPGACSFNLSPGQVKLPHHPPRGAICTPSLGQGDRPAAGLVGYVIRAFCVPFDAQVSLYFLPFAFVPCGGFYSLPEGSFVWLSSYANGKQEKDFN